jgi:D-3-phosphoglycerate dehydrogenase
MVHRILVSDPIAKEGLAVFEKAEGMKVDVNTGLPEDEICKIIPDYDALIVRSQTQVTAKVIEAGRNLKIIGRAGVGLDNVNLEAANRNGIVVMNVPGGNTISTAELSFAMILALSRNIPQAYNSLRKGEWDRKTYKGVEIRNKTLGILGVGRIGTEVARRARAFEMRVIAHDPYLSEEKAKQIGVEIKSFVDLLKESDYLTIHTPLNDETRNMIGKEQLALMKKGARIVNCARGGIVDEPALKEAILNKHIAGAAFDVYPKEPPEYRDLIDLPQCICTPHLGASTEEAQSLVAVDLAYQIVDALQGKGIRNAVNMPFVDPNLMERLKPYILLGEKLGSLGAQMLKGPVVKLHIDYIGEATEFDVSPITVATLKGALQPYLDTVVNYVNAPFIAKERGLAYSETKRVEEGAYTNVISLTVQSKDREMTVWGTVFAAKKDPRVVRIDGYHVDMKPFGRHLIIKNTDKPGFIGKVGTVLGNAGVNIADMTLGRLEKGGLAVTAIAVDGELSDALLKEIRDLEYVETLCLVNLGK